MRESRPLVAMRPIETDVVPGTPYDEAMAAFVTVYQGPDVEIAFRRALWTEVMTPTTSVELSGPQSPIDLPPIESADSGWTTRLTGPTRMLLEARAATTPLRLLSTADRCWRLDAMLERSSDQGSFQLLFTPPGDSTSEPVRIGTDGERTWSGTRSTLWLERPLERSIASSEPVPFTIVITDRSAVMMIDDRIVAAVPVNAGDVVSIEALSDTLAIRDLHLSSMNMLEGCER